MKMYVKSVEQNDKDVVFHCATIEDAEHIIFEFNNIQRKHSMNKKFEKLLNDGIETLS